MRAVVVTAQQVRKPDGSLSECQHCFPVYGGGLEVKGVQGILQVRTALVTTTTIADAAAGLDVVVVVAVLLTLYSDSGLQSEGWGWGLV